MQDPNCSMPAVGCLRTAPAPHVPALLPAALLCIRPRPRAQLGSAMRPNRAKTCVPKAAACNHQGHRPGLVPWPQSQAIEHDNHNPCCGMQQGPATQHRELDWPALLGVTPAQAAHAPRGTGRYKAQHAGTSEHLYPGLQTGSRNPCSQHNTCWVEAAPGWFAALVRAVQVTTWVSDRGLRMLADVILL